MKKILVKVLALSLLAGTLFACSPNAKAPAGTAAADGKKAADDGGINFETAANEAAPSFDGLEGKTKDGKKIKIGFSISANDQYGSIMSTAMITKATSLGVDVKLAEAKENDNTMISQVQQFASEGSDVIVVQLTNTKIAQKVIDSANGVPVVFLNRIPVGSFTGKAYYVGSDDKQAGIIQGEALAKFFEAAGKKDVKIVQLTGVVGASNATFRTQGVKEALEKAGLKMSYAYNDTAEWDRTKANNKMQTFLGTSPQIDAVAANNDEMALGAILAMEQKGIDFTKVPVVGVDGTKDGLQAIADGKLYASVFQDAAAQGEGALAVAMALANGKTPPVKVDIPFKLITKDNLAEFMK